MRNPFKETLRCYTRIDQHKSQLTVNVRGEDGETIFKRQVSTLWEKVEEFFADFGGTGQAEGGFMAILEVRGMNPWLIDMLREHGCREIVVTQPTTRSKKKPTAATPAFEQLAVDQPSAARGREASARDAADSTADAAEAADRQVTAFRAALTKKRTATLNAIHKRLRKHNLEQECPTKKFQTQKVRRWLESLRWPNGLLEMDFLLRQWTLWDQQLAAVEVKIAVRAATDEQSKTLQSMPGTRRVHAAAIARGSAISSGWKRPSSSANDSA